MPLFIFGQSYASLWKKVAEASEKDLPKTEYEVLQRIVKKAAKSKDYGQLLKAELLKVGSDIISARIGGPVSVTKSIVHHLDLDI